MNKGKPMYAISVVSEVLGLHPQTLRQYERMGLIIPSRSVGNTRLYSDNDLEHLRYITALTKDMGVNLAGVEIIMQMREQINTLNEQISLISEHIKFKYGEEIKLRKEIANNEKSITKVKIERG